MKTVLVTGANSFTGKWLIPALQADSRIGSIVLTDLHPKGLSGHPYIAADLTVEGSALDAIRESRPDLVFHLAGVSSPDADLCFHVNLKGTRRLLDALAANTPAPAVVVVSSAAVYGLTRPEESPLVEETPLRPVSAYGASKAAAELAALALHRQGKLPVSVIRPFNLVGPGLPAGFAPSDFLLQAHAAAAGTGPPEVRVGNLDPERDFVDVRDAVRAYLAVGFAEDLRGRAVNVASGRGVTMRNLLDCVLDVVGRAVPVRSDPSRQRPVDVRVQTANIDAVRRATGWAPALPLADSLRDMLAALH